MKTLVPQRCWFHGNASLVDNYMESHCSQSQSPQGRVDFKVNDAVKRAVRWRSARERWL